jgi:hypothetical protein
LFGRASGKSASIVINIGCYDSILNIGNEAINNYIRNNLGFLDFMHRLVLEREPKVSRTGPVAVLR